MFFSAQRLFPRNHRDSQDVFWRLSTEQFLVPENISNIKMSWKKNKFHPRKKKHGNEKLVVWKCLSFSKGYFQVPC